MVQHYLVKGKVRQGAFVSPIKAASLGMPSSYMSVIMWSHPWSWGFNALRSAVMSARNANSHVHFSSHKMVVFSFTVHELTDFVAELKNSVENLANVPLCNKGSRQTLNPSPIERTEIAGEVNLYFG